MSEPKPIPGPAMAAEPRVRLIPFDQIRLGRERRYVVKGVLPRVGLIVVWGPPKCGKSFWMFDAAMHIALGWEYRGRRVQQGSVVYCAFEGQSGLEARVEAFRQRRLSEDCADVPFYLEPLTLDLVADHGELVAEIRRQVAEPPVLVVLDTLNRSLRGSESNDEDMGDYVKAADAIRAAFACAVVVVHHCGTVGNRPRGHTSLTGAADAQLSVNRDGADNIVVTVECMKDGPSGDTILSRLEIVEVGIDEDGDTITSCVIVPIDDEAAPAEPRRRKAARLSTNETILLRALGFVLDHGQTEPAPFLPGVPGGTVAVRIEDVRARAYASGLKCDGDNQGTARKRWNRARQDLIAKGKIRVEEDLVWPT